MKRKLEFSSLDGSRTTHLPLPSNEPSGKKTVEPSLSFQPQQQQGQSTSSTIPPNLILTRLQPDLMRHVISYFMGVVVVVDPCDDPRATSGGPATASSSFGNPSHDNNNNNACWIVDVDSVTALAQTCRTWNQAVSDPQLWTVHSSQSFQSQSPPTTRMIPGHCFFHQPLLHNNNKMKKGQGHSCPPPPLVGFVRVVTPMTKQEKSSHSGSPEDHQQPVVDATSTTTTTSTTDSWWWMVREHASHETFFVSQCRDPSLPTCLQESFVFGYCYAWQCRTRREFYTLYKQQQQQQQQQQQLKQQSSSRRLLLRVPYVCQSVPNPHTDPQHSDHSNSTRSWLRRVYFPESHALTPAMVDTHVGRWHLFQSHVWTQPPENDATPTATTPHHAPLQDDKTMRPTENHNNNNHNHNKVEDEDNLGLVVGLWHHYQRLEHAAYPTTASTTITTSTTSTTTRTAWFQLLDWVCELVHVLEVPHTVAFRTAVCLAPLVQDYGQQQQPQQSQPPHAEQPRPRRLPPLQLVTAAVVYMASCVSVGGPSHHNHHNDNHNTDQSSLEPPFSSHRLLSLEHLAFCVDNQWPARTIQAVARLLWLRGAASSPSLPLHDDDDDDDDWSHSNSNPKTTTPLLGPAQLATPTVEQWLHVYLETRSTTTTTTTTTFRLDPATVRALALDVAWFLLPSSLSLELRPRHLAACIVVMARWARQLVPQQPEATPNDDDNDQDQTASLPSLVQPPVDLNWTWATACHLWCALEPRGSVTCTTTTSSTTSVFWDHEVVPLLPRVLETLHRLYPEQWWATNHHATTTASRVVWGHRRRRRRPCSHTTQHSNHAEGLNVQQPQEQEQEQHEGMEAAASLYRLWSQSR